MQYHKQTHDPHMKEARFRPRRHVITVATVLFSLPRSPRKRDGTPYSDTAATNSRPTVKARLSVAARRPTICVKLSVHIDG